MNRPQKRMLLLVLALVGLVITTSLVYMLGMTHLEGRSRGFWSALEWASETISTTGYGADHTWKHPLMVIYVAVVQFIGVFLVFLIFPIYLIPVLEERFQSKTPTEARDARNHVLVFQHGPAVATLLEELSAAGEPTLIIEEDEDEARSLMERGYRVVHGRLDEDVFSLCALEHARALVLNSSDERNAAATITARQSGFRGDILALVETPLHRQPMMLAGATATYTPRLVLGAALAARASRRITTAVPGIQQLGSRLQVSEARIARDSKLAGQTLAEASIGQATGVTVIGQWIGGKLTANPSPDMRLEPGGILIVVGSNASIERFTGLCSGTTHLRRSGPIVVAGYGDVGRKVVELLDDVGEQTRVISIEEDDGVDVVGNAVDPQALEAAGVKDAQAVVVAVGDDQSSLLATIILKDLAPAVPVIARVNRAENLKRIYGAGAEFALSISQVAGQLLAWRLLGKQAVSVDPRLKILSTRSGSLTRQHPAGLRIRDKTGCSVVAVERGREMLVEFGRDFRFQADDTVHICGTVEATRKFEEIFPATR